MSYSIHIKQDRKVHYKLVTMATNTLSYMCREQIATQFFKDKYWVKITEPLFYTNFLKIWEQCTYITCHITGQTVRLFF